MTDDQFTSYKTQHGGAVARIMLDRPDAQIFPADEVSDGRSAPPIVPAEKTTVRADP